MGMKTTYSAASSNVSNVIRRVGTKAWKQENVYTGLILKTVTVTPIAALNSVLHHRRNHNQVVLKDRVQQMKTPLTSVSMTN